MKKPRMPSWTARWTRGVNFIDTAEMYSVPARAETFGSTETIIGNWFAKNPVGP
jgi:aryl-alcohol dehydrogenase-like predicted oxidoreductase